MNNELNGGNVNSAAGMLEAAYAREAVYVAQTVCEPFETGDTNGFMEKVLEEEFKELSMCGRPYMSYDEYMSVTSESRRKTGKDPQKDPLDMDFSAFNTDSRQLILECRGTVYGYVRVSTDHQDYARQIDAMKRLGVIEENIFKDKKSGKDFDRDAYRQLMEILEPGDLVVVLALDRFGRNMTEIKNQWCWITQHRRAGIVVIEQPILNTRLGMHGLGNFIADLILAVFSLMAELERSFISKRMGDGLRRVKLEGKKLGRKTLPIPEPFWEMKEKFLEGGISQNKASKVLGVDSHTFRRWIVRTESIFCARDWEALSAELEEQEKAERIRLARIEYGETGETGEAGDEEENARAGLAAKVWKNPEHTERDGKEKTLQA